MGSSSQSSESARRFRPRGGPGGNSNGKSSALAHVASAASIEKPTRVGSGVASALLAIVVAVSLAAAARYRWRCGDIPPHYHVLGVCRDASIAQIREAFYALTKRHAAQQEHVQMQEAFHVLSRPELRTRYDERWDSERVEARGEPVLQQILVQLDQMLQNVGTDVGTDRGSALGNWRHFFRILAESKAFRREVWQRRPMIFGRLKPFVWARETCVNWLELRSELHADPEVEVVQFDAAVSRGVAKTWTSSRIVASEQLSGIILNSTIFVNFVWTVTPQVSLINEALVAEFGLPSNTNLYATAPGLRFDSVPHSDSQDVFILQCQGRKHWKVWTPPKLLPTWHQRGKGGDEIDPDALGPPIVDIVLEPFQVMYVPLGFAHLTTTDEARIGYTGGVGRGDMSVHLTVGAETISAGLTMGAFLRCLLAQNNLKKGHRAALMEHFLTIVEHDIDFRRPLPLGFLMKDIDNFAPLATTRKRQKYLATSIASVASQLLDRLARELDEEARAELEQKLPPARVEAVVLKHLELYDKFLARHLEEFRGTGSLVSSSSGDRTLASNASWRQQHRQAPMSSLMEQFQATCNLETLGRPAKSRS